MHKRSRQAKPISPDPTHLAAILDAEGAFTGLRWRDARGVAATVAFDACTEDDPEAVPRERARTLLAEGGSAWMDASTVARAHKAV